MNQIPIIFAITGHRDLRKQDIEKLKDSVGGIFDEFKTKYPNTPLILISALAEGADMLVADVATSKGVKLFVLLPYEKDEYIKSFESDENIEAFNTLYNKADKILPNVTSKKEHTSTECYEMLGHSLADKSNILLALWDGKDLGKAGGTSEVVKYQRDGIKESRFDDMDDSAIFIIKTPRESNPINSNFEVQKEFLGNINEDKYHKLLQKIDSINQELKDTKQKSDNIVEHLSNFFSKKAKVNQATFKQAWVAILLSTALAFGFLEYMHNFQKEQLLWGYGIGLIVAFVIYFVFMKKGKVQDDFIFSRGISEAIRVQNALNGGKITKSVANDYLKGENYKYSWIKLILKNLYTLEKRPFVPEYEKGSKPIDWIEGQIDYFEKGIKKRENSLKRWEKAEKIFYYLGLVLLIAIFVWHLAGEHLVGEEEAKHILHPLIFGSGISLLVATFIGEKYLKIAGFKEEIYNYEKMLKHFKKAQNTLQTQTPDTPEYQKTVKDLALKALEENSKWVVLHDKHRVKPSVD